MYVEYNPNPIHGIRVGDCSIRALAKTLDTTWETAYALAALKGFALGDLPNSNSVTGSILRDHGFKRAIVPNECPDCYTIKDFCEENKNGTFFLGTGDHVVSSKDGDYFDSWDSGDESLLYVWYKDFTPVFDI